MKLNFLTRMLDRVTASAKMQLGLSLKMKGHFKWKLFDPVSGLVYETGERHNLIVTTGKNFAAARFVANTAAVPGWIAIGSNAAAVAVGDTTLGTETARVALSSITSANNVASFVATVPAGTGTGTVNEVGLLNAAAAGTLIAHALTGTITKPAALSLQFNWDITFS